MTIQTLLFYVIAALIVIPAGIAVTQRNTVQAVLFLVIFFFTSAMLFYLLGAPLLAVFEVIIYAGAIMVVFLFAVMMMRLPPLKRPGFAVWKHVAFGVIGITYLISLFLLTTGTNLDPRPMSAAMVTPVKYGLYVFQRHWLAIEIISILLLIALIGALHLGVGYGRKQALPENISANDPKKE